MSDLTSILPNNFVNLNHRRSLISLWYPLNVKTLLNSIVNINKPSLVEMKYISQTQIDELSENLVKYHHNFDPEYYELLKPLMLKKVQKALIDFYQDWIKRWSTFHEHHYIAADQTYNYFKDEKDKIFSTDTYYNLENALFSIMVGLDSLSPEAKEYIKSAKSHNNIYFSLDEMIQVRSSGVPWHESHREMMEEIYFFFLGDEDDDLDVDA